MRIFLAFAILLISFNSAVGCSYFGYPDPPFKYLISKLQTIYIGRVISKKTSDERDAFGRLFRVRRFKLRVEKHLKGDNQEIQEIAIYEPLPIVKSSCYIEPPNIKVGETWIIQKDYDPQTWSQLSGLRLSPYRYLKFDPKEDADYLESLEKIVRNPVTAVYGQVDNSPAFASNKPIEVYLEGEGRRLSAVPDGFGHYSFENIPAGNYKIQIRFPVTARDFDTKRETVYNEQTKTYNFEYEVSLKSGDSDFYYVLANRPVLAFRD